MELFGSTLSKSLSDPFQPLAVAAQAIPGLLLGCIDGLEGHVVVTVIRKVRNPAHLLRGGQGQALHAGMPTAG